MTNEIKTAYKYLNRNPVLHIDMTDALALRLAKPVYAAEDGVALYLEISDTYFVSVDNLDVFKKILSVLPQDWHAIVTHQMSAYYYLLKNYAINRIVPCYNVIYPETMEEKHPDPCAVKALDMSYLETVRAAYTHYDAGVEFQRNIKKKALFGAFVDGNLAGFISYHAEGPLGMLHVYPAYRRRGIAESLLAAAVRHKRDCNETAYCQIIESNKASIAMHKKLGCLFSEPVIMWTMR